MIRDAAARGRVPWQGTLTNCTYPIILKNMNSCVEHVPKLVKPCRVGWNNGQLVMYLTVLHVID